MSFIIVFSCVSLHSRGVLVLLSILLSIFAARHPSSLAQTTELRWRRGGGRGSG